MRGEGEILERERELGLGFPWGEKERDIRFEKKREGENDFTLSK